METYDFGDFRVNVPGRELRRASGDVIPLTPRVFDLLLALIEARGRVVSKNELLESVWVDCIVEESNLSQSIFVLRKALGDNAANPKFIRTIPLKGYRFIASVNPESSEIDPYHSSKKGFVDDTHLTDLIHDRAETPALGKTLQSPAAKSWSMLLSSRLMLVSLGILSLFVLLLLGGFFRSPLKRNDSIAVLPFVNKRSDPNMDYLSDGFSESVTNTFSRISVLRVPASSVVSKYKGVDIDPIKIGSDLAVGSVLVGNIEQDGETINIHVELVGALDGTLLWGETYKRKSSDMLGVPEEIARRVSERLHLEINSADQSRLSRRYTQNGEAYVLYLKGRFFWRKYTKDGLRSAIEYYNQALAIDPNYALAYAGISDCFNMMGSASQMAPSEAFIPARNAAMKALELDNDLAEAHLALAWTRFAFDWQWDAAEIEFRRAIELNPNHPQSHFWYSILLDATGRFDEALNEIQRAYELDPIYLERGMGTALYLSRRYDDAINFYKKSLESNPNNINTHWFLDITYRVTGKYSEALSALERSIRIEDAQSEKQDISGSPSFSRVDFSQGYYSVERQMIRIYLDESERQYVSPRNIADSYIAIHDKENAILWLNKGNEIHAAGMYLLAVDPVWDDLRTDPRFQEILRKMNLDNVRPAPMN
jgi:DNA-binding winged helix-turn-helix (wHTH) protein/TolB-like protein